jgi:hypothetical protein
MRIPVPEKINRAIGQESPDGSARSVFWNCHDSTNLGVMSDEPLLSNPEFSYLSESGYLAERKNNGDWDVRPPDSVISKVCSDFKNDENVFFFLKEDWLAEDPKGVYVLTTKDLIRYLPCLQELKQDFSQLKSIDSNVDTPRLQETGRGSNLQIQSLVTIFERTGLTDLESLVNQAFTTGKIETDFELPRPE